MEVGDPRAVAVVSGYAPDVRWRVIMQAATLIRNGLPWVATNTDLTLPTDNGLAPGHGMLVRLISDFAGVDARQVAGKPQRPLLDETRRRVSGRRPLMIGDRLDTDIAGGIEAGTDSLLVMTGVSSVDDCRRRRLRRASDVDRRTTSRRCVVPAWQATSDGDLVVVRAVACRASTVDGWSSTGEAKQTQDADAWWTAVAAAGWDHLDGAGSPADTGGVTGPGRPTASG